MSGVGARRSIAIAMLAGLGLVVLDALGRGALASPPFESSARFLSYVDEQGGLISAFSLLRLVTIGVGWYLVAVAVLSVTARAIGSVALLRTIDWLTLPSVRRLLTGAAGLGFSSAVVLGSITSAGAGEPPTSSDRLVELPVSTGPAGDDVATMRVLSPAPAPADDTEHLGNQWTVAPGDSFWSIAHETLAGAAGRSLSDREVAAYWKQLIDANRDMLVVPGDVDLLFPGQVVALPAVTEA
jgi:hypothetical protein